MFGRIEIRRGRGVDLFHSDKESPVKLKEKIECYVMGYHLPPTGRETPLELAARAAWWAKACGGDAETITRAVLTAVREPTKPLWLAGMAGTNGLRNEITPETVSASFTAVIDAILSEERGR